MRKSILIDWKSVEQKILDINSNIKNPNEFLTLKKSGNVVNAYLKANGEYLFQTNALDFPCFNYRDEFVGKLDIKNQELEVFTYADLHIHTEYSILDGANRISDLSKKFGYYGAITDHGVMYGCVDFDKKMNALHKHSIKGFEMYTESWKYYQALNEGNLSEDEMQTLKNENKNVKFHLIGLAMNETGYKNLVKLCSYGQSNVGGSFPKRPRVSYEELVKHKEGIIILSACIGGEIPQRIIKNDLDTAQAMIKFFKNEFGENFYLEIQKHASESKLETLLEDLQFKTGVKVSLSEVSNDYYSYKNGLIKRNDFVSKYNNKILKETELIISEEIVNEALVDLSNAFDVKLVVTTDAHYLNPEDAYAHEALLCNQTGKTMNDPSHMFFSGDGYYVHTTDEIENKFREYPEAIINTIEVAEKCNFNFEFGNYKLPNFPIPDGYTDVEYLKKLVYDGFKERFGHLSQAEQNEYRLRLEFELNVIFKMGYQGYFFIVWDYIRYAKENNIYVGPGRGSGAGSIVLYCLRITENLDPIQYGLLFERFLNPDRVSMPK